MVEFDYEIQDKQGVHAKSAGALVQAAGRLNSKVTMVARNQEVDCNKLVAMMRLGIGYKEVVTFRLEGQHAADELAELQGFCKNNV